MAICFKCKKDVERGTLYVPDEGEKGSPAFYCRECLPPDPNAPPNALDKLLADRESKLLAEHERANAGRA